MAKKKSAKSKARSVKVKPGKRPRAIPTGFTTLTPYLWVDGAAEAIEFYKKAFGATEVYRLPMPGGKIAHAELDLGSSKLLLADADERFGNKSPRLLGGAGAGMCLYTADCDALFARAVKAGARPVRPLETQFYGDRSGTLVDPWGHPWTIATRVEDVSPEEMADRMARLGPPAGA